MKKNIIASLILALSFIIIGVSGSYAFFVNSVQEKNPENKSLNITSGDLTMNFDTTQSKYLKLTNEGLIKDETITSQEKNYAKFTVNFPSSNTIQTATYDLYLTDINMSCNFKSQYLKWALYSDTAPLSEPIAQGNFAGLTSSSCSQAETATTTQSAFSNLTLKNQISITNGAKQSYRLYIWLSYDQNVNQKNLLQGSLSAKVGFTATSNNPNP